MVWLRTSNVATSWLGFGKDCGGVGDNRQLKWNLCKSILLLHSSVFHFFVVTLLVLKIKWKVIHFLSVACSLWKGSHALNCLQAVLVVVIIIALFIFSYLNSHYFQEERLSIWRGRIIVEKFADWFIGYCLCGLLLFIHCLNFKVFCK